MIDLLLLLLLIIIRNEVHSRGSRLTYPTFNNQFFYINTERMLLKKENIIINCLYTNG